MSKQYTGPLWPTHRRKAVLKRRKRRPIIEAHQRHAKGETQ